jgi:hypothetical protein
MNPQLILYLYQLEDRFGWSAELPNCETLGIYETDDVQFGQVAEYVCRFLTRDLALRNARYILSNQGFFKEIIRVYSPNKTSFAHLSLCDLERLGRSKWVNIPDDVLADLKRLGWDGSRSYVPPGSVLAQCLSRPNDRARYSRAYIHHGFSNICGPDFSRSS